MKCLAAADMLRGQVRLPFRILAATCKSVHAVRGRPVSTGAHMCSKVNERPDMYIASVGAKILG